MHIERVDLLRLVRLVLYLVARPALHILPVHALVNLCRDDIQ